MKQKKMTWIGFLVTLSTFVSSAKTLAENPNPVIESEVKPIENRLNRIAKTLQERERYLPKSSDIDNSDNFSPDIEVAGWLKGSRGSFLNNRRGGGFVNNRYGGGWLNGSRWRDRGGFLNRSPWRNRTGFLNRRRYY